MIVNRPQIDVVVIAAYLMGSLALAAHYDPLTWRSIAIYGVVSPAVGLLFLFGHQRARFAVYIFLSIDIVRTLIGARWIALAIDVAVLLYLQTPRMRRRYPRIDSGEIAARWRA